jgi:hypothetical protein
METAIDYFYGNIKKLRRAFMTGSRFESLTSPLSRKPSYVHITS